MFCIFWFKIAHCSWTMNILLSRCLWTTKWVASHLMMCQKIATWRHEKCCYPLICYKPHSCTPFPLLHLWKVLWCSLMMIFHQDHYFYYDHLWSLYSRPAFLLRNSLLWKSISKSRKTIISIADCALKAEHTPQNGTFS